MLGDSRKRLTAFPVAVQEAMAEALAMAVLGEKHHLAKPMQGFGSGVFEIAKPYRKDAYRAVYAVQLGDRYMFCTRSRRNPHLASKCRKEIPN